MIVSNDEICHATLNSIVGCAQYPTSVAVWHADTLPVVQISVDSDGEPVDVEFYQRFWGLQDIFKDPYKHMRPVPLSTVVTRVPNVYKHFDDGDVSAAGTASLATGARPRSARPRDTASQHWLVSSSNLPFAVLRQVARFQSHLALRADGEGLCAVKYLSSSRLLKLQLRDATFRRHFLLQVLIFLHTVQHPGKGAPPEAQGGLKPKQVPAAHTEFPCKTCRCCSTGSIVNGKRHSLVTWLYIGFRRVMICAG